MSHELRTPLNTIIGMTGLALHQASAPKLVNQLTKIDAASTHLLQIISDILDISRIEAEPLTLQHIQFNMAELLEKLMRVVEPRAKEKGLRLRVEVPPELKHLSLLGDPLRLDQVVRNLVDNAVKFTTAGAVTVRITVVEDRLREVLLRFEVQDSGLGIAPVDQKRLFTAFEQVDASMTRKHGGTGLGLAISKRLAELMGGEIGVDSAVGVGSTFWVTTRLEKATPNAHSLASPEPPLDRDAATQQIQARFAGARILVAEDEPITQEILKWLLEEAGLAVDVACDGAFALALARSHAYALILLGLRMPQLNGLQAARAIRADSLNRNTPIIATTADAFDGDRQACMDAGMDDHLGTPINPDGVLKAVASWLGKRSATGDAATGDAP